MAHAGDLLWLGVATHFCPTGAIAALREEMEADPRAAEAALARRCAAGPAAAAVAPGGAGGASSPPPPPPPGPLERNRALLERCFAPLLADVEAGGLAPAAALAKLMDRLERELGACEVGAPGGAADADADAAALLRAALDSLRATSPGSQALTLAHFAAVHAAAGGSGSSGSGDSSSSSGDGGKAAPPVASLRGVMAVEYAMAVRRVAQPDFAEGVRALLVDKDKAPRWRPAALADVDAAEARALLAPLPRGAPALDLAEVDAALAAMARAEVGNGGGEGGRRRLN